MFILVFFLIMSLAQFITNKVIGIDDTLEDSYTYNKKDSLYIGILLLVGIILEVLTSLKTDVIVRLLNGATYWIIVAVYAVTSLLLMVILSEGRKTEISKKRADLEQVYEILIPIVDKGGKNGLDYNTPPFRLNYKYGDIQKIEVDIDPVTFKGDDKTLVAVVSQLDTFLTTFKWTYDTSRTSERLLEFIGEDKPPQLARWPGSWLRNFRFMPTGISGRGEVGFTADDVPKNLVGRSLFLNDNGEYIPQDTSLPKQPQALVCGATGGGKSVWVQNVIMHCIEHRDKIAVALVDPKQVEFSTYNGMNGILGVATSTLEATEILRISRAVMYKRNKELQKLGLKNIAEYKPHEKTGKVYITGKELKEDDMIKVRINGEERMMRASELVEFLKEE